MKEPKNFKYKNRENIASEVLEAFQKVSPSKIEVEDEDELRDYTHKLFNLFYKVLKFPPQLFNGKKVLDFGCGTGEVDLVIANWGADVEGFDFNPDSIERAQMLANASTTAGSLKFSIGDVHNFELLPESFDMVISMGVIAHVKDQRLMFKRMVEACKPGGFIVLGYIDSAGQVQRLLHRAIITTGRDSAGMNEEGVHKLALSIFGEHIERSVQMGGRTAASVINDYLVNPHYLGIDLNEIMKWVSEENLDLYSYWPCLGYPFSIDSPYKDNNPVKSSIFKNWSSYLKLRWMYALREDEEVLCNIAKGMPDINKEVEELFYNINEVLQNKHITAEHVKSIKIKLSKIEIKVNKGIVGFHNYISSSIAELNDELTEVFNIIKRVSDGQIDKAEVTSNRLFRGYNGLGTNYTVLCKE